MEFSVKAKLTDLGVDIDSFDAGTVAVFEQSIFGLAKGAQNEWVRLAQERLGTSKEIYINGLRQAESFKMVTTGNTTYEISLVGKMPNDFEFGMPSFDMKTVRPGWLGGGKAKTSKDGSKYVVIPFRHSTTSERFAYTGKAKGVTPDLKGQLRKAVKDYGLDRMTRAGTGQVVSGVTARIPNKAAVHSYLRGMVRTQTPTAGTTKSGQGRGSSTLTTFRIMSEKSDPSSWIHPGLKPANLVAEVETWVDSQLDRMIETMFGG